MMEKVAPLIGIPWAPGGRDRRGVDCWGLVVMGLRELYGISVPDTGPYDLRDHAACAAIVRATTARGLWREVKLGEERPGDVVLMETGGYPVHVGLVVEKGTMLHIVRGKTSALASYRTGPWARRVVGVWRWSP